jgi:hypothetical protein
VAKTIAKKKSKLGNPAPNRHERRKAAALSSKKSKPKVKLAATGKPASPRLKPKTKLAAEEDDEEEDEEMDADDDDSDEVDDPTDTEEAEGDEADDCDCEGEEDCDCDDEADDAEEEDLGADDEGAGKQSTGKRKGKLTPAQKEAQRFVNAFGDKGGRWYAEGLTFERAQVRFNKSVRKENSKLQKQVADQAAQLSALRGEEEPVSGGAEKPKPKIINGLTAGLSKFAATLKLPKSNR